jgi:hypothetical protein
VSSPTVRTVVAAIVAALVGIGVTFAVTTGTDEGGRATRTVQVRVGGGPIIPPPQTKVDTNGQKPGVQPGVVNAPPDARVQAGAGLDDHQGERNETPPGVTPAQLEAGRQQQERLAQNDQLPTVSPFTAPSERGCTTALVRNYSTRRGVKPRIFVLHYTVSPNRPGIGDVNAVVNLFNTPSFAASSNYVIDREGNCKYIVRESDKAWAQAAANSLAISVEVINSGREPSYISGAGLTKLATVMADATKRWSIPLQIGAVSGCTVTRAGIVTHQMLGACGGGHVDISPYGTSVVEQVIAAAKRVRGGGSAKPVTSTDRVTCRKLNWWRTHGRPHGAAEANAVRRRKALDSRHVTCLASGPVRR